MSRANEWATRLHHEAQQHDENCFITLTYEDGQLPADGSVSKRALQLFLKRLRFEVSGTRLRYFGCGEYGDLGGRPHYHAILFGYGFPDRTLWRKSPTGHLLYRSALLERVWPFGNCEIGSVSPESAGYVARYCLKRITPDSELGKAYYLRAHPVSGAVFEVAPEFALMSRRPGLGSGWFDEFSRDCFPSDFVIVDGEKRPVPSYYKKKLSWVEQLRVSSRQLVRARADAENSTPERLATREQSKLLRVKQLKREGT